MGIGCQQGGGDLGSLRPWALVTCGDLAAETPVLVTRGDTVETLHACNMWLRSIALLAHGNNAAEPPTLMTPVEAMLRRSCDSDMQ